MDESNLLITNINTADGANYTCLVKSELEQKSASARLMVMGMIPHEIIHIFASVWPLKVMIVCFCEDRPDPPTDLELSDPHERNVRLSWVPGNSNHNPITGESSPGISLSQRFMSTFCHLPHTCSTADYLVQYDDDDWLPGKWKNLSLYPGNLNSVILHLLPFTYYEFRVIAINEIGMSRPSRPSARFQSSGARAFAAPNTYTPPPNRYSKYTSNINSAN